jgi:hypothetical protein
MQFRMLASDVEPIHPRAGGASTGGRSAVRVPDSRRMGAIYTGIARNVAVRYARHVARIGARYTRANPPSRLLVKFACLSQSEGSKMAILRSCGSVATCSARPAPGLAVAWGSAASNEPLLAAISRQLAPRAPKR